MKLIGRTLVILAAALVVVGATFGVSRSSLASGMRSFPAEGPRAGQQLVNREQGQASGVQSAAPRFERGGFEGREGRPGGSAIFGILGVLKNVMVIGAIVAGVSLVSRLMQRSQPDRPVRRPPPSEPPALI